MTEAKFKEAKRLEFRITRLEIFIKNIANQDHFCNAIDIHEAPETTAAAKKILLDDLNQRLAEEQAAFENL